jgi:hypothetical protein
MDASEAAEHIVEALEDERAENRVAEVFRSRAALIIALLAMLLAIATLGGDNAAEDMMAANIHASDSWAFYQAKNVRQTSNTLAADELEAQLLIHGARLDAGTRAGLQKKIAAYRSTAVRYEDEPDENEPNDPLKGEGKKQIKAQAQDWEQQRELAARRDANFDYSTILFQVAVVLGSVAILATSRFLLAISIGFGVLGTGLMINGFLLLTHLPLIG